MQNLSLIRTFKGLIRPLVGLIRPSKYLMRPFKGHSALSPSRWTTPPEPRGSKEPGGARRSQEELVARMSVFKLGVARKSQEGCQDAHWKILQLRLAQAAKTEKAAHKVTPNDFDIPLPSPPKPSATPQPGPDCGKNSSSSSSASSSSSSSSPERTLQGSSRAL